MDSKRTAAEKSVTYLKDGMIVGLGTGSTTYWAIKKIGDEISKGLHLQAVATSIESEKLANEFKIPLISIEEAEKIDVTIDGADEVDSEWRLIKGGGGALLREKIVASSSKELIIIVDESKLVTHLGNFPLPVEVVKFGYKQTLKKLAALGCTVQLRMRGEKQFVTDNGNFIADCSFGIIDHPKELQQEINLMPGVVDNGLFIDLAAKVIVGYQDGSVKELSR